MGANTHIQWCDYTFNPWEGCTKVSPGCVHCYAEARDIRFTGGKHWGKGAPRRRTSAGHWSLPVLWNRAAHLFLQCTQGCRFQSTEAGLEDFCPVCGDPQADAVRPRVFCASLADWLDDEVPVEWLADLLQLIRATPDLDWLLLTKRPENWLGRMASVLNDFTSRTQATDANMAFINWLQAWVKDTPPANIWIGTTAEDQPRADERVPLLLQIPARVRFLSIEPMLEQVNLAAALWNNASEASVEPFLRSSGGKIAETTLLPGIDWAICGGESGPGARPFMVEWADDLRRQCQEARVAFFMKQLGANPITSNANALDWPEETVFRDDLLDSEWAAGASIGLKDRKGGDIAEFPEELRIREFPNGAGQTRRVPDSQTHK